jgi:hypothetical protein
MIQFANETTRLFPKVPALPSGPGWVYRGMGWNPKRDAKEYAFRSDLCAEWIFSTGRVPGGCGGLHYAEKVSQITLKN